MPRGLVVHVRPAWVADGETRLSYTTIIGLVECCRECHWQSDILPSAGSVPVDSITKTLAAKFHRPIAPRAVITINYLVSCIRERGYLLRFNVREQGTEEVSASVDLVSVFYDASLSEAVEPPAAVLASLRKLHDTDGH
jgi:acyl-CoA thioesterase FadM